jgi:hypothetical protein
VITEADTAFAERLLGIVYTARERVQMVGNLNGQIASATARRKVRLANSMPMGSRFDPRLPTFRVPALAGPLRFSQSVIPMPSDDADIAFAPLTDLSAWISSGALSSRRLTEIYLDRIASIGPKLECFSIVTVDLACAEADAADALLRKASASAHSTASLMA